jgi:hypothetical protein
MEQTRALIAANLGGPYGSSQLPSVQEAGNKVLSSVFDGKVGAAEGWYKAKIAIEGREKEEGAWTCRADKVGSTVFPYPKR